MGRKGPRVKATPRYPPRYRADCRLRQDAGSLRSSCSVSQVHGVEKEGRGLLPIIKLVIAGHDQDALIIIHKIATLPTLRYFWMKFKPEIYK